MKKHRAIREGDWVKIVTPKIVLRVGYPKTVDDFIPIAKEHFKNTLTAVFGYNTNLDRVYRELAYQLLKKAGFGGRERSLHLLDQPHLAGVTVQVQRVRTVMTGRYYPSSGGGDYYTDDYEPAGLADQKAHRLISFYEPTPQFRFAIGGKDGCVEIPAYFVDRGEQL